MLDMKSVFFSKPDNKSPRKNAGFSLGQSTIRPAPSNTTMA